MLSIRCNSRLKSWKNRKKSERITKIKPFIYKYKLYISSEKDD